MKMVLQLAIVTLLTVTGAVLSSARAEEQLSAELEPEILRSILSKSNDPQQRLAASALGDDALLRFVRNLNQPKAQTTIERSNSDFSPAKPSSPLP